MSTASDWIKSTTTLARQRRYEVESLLNLREWLTDAQYTELINQIKMEKNLTDNQRQVWMQLKKSHDAQHVKEWLVLVTENRLSDEEMKVWIQQRKIRKSLPEKESETGIEHWIESVEFRRLCEELQLKYQLTDMELKIWLEYPIRFSGEEMEIWATFKSHLSENVSIRRLETPELKIRLEGDGLEDWVERLKALGDDSDEEVDFDECKLTRVEIIEKNMYQ